MQTQIPMTIRIVASTFASAPAAIAQHAQSARATEIVRAVPGVRSVQNEVRVS